MNRHQLEPSPYPEASPQRAASYRDYRIGPTGQRQILLNAVGIPQPGPLSALSLATLPQGAKRDSAGQVIPAIRNESINSSFISRIYSAQIPNQSFPPKLLANALEKELKALEADDYFINDLFPTKLLPFGMSDENIIAELSKPHNGNPSIWNGHCFRDTASALSESELASWLNTIGTTLGEAFQHSPLRLWSHISCNTPPVGGSPTIIRKPDLVLLDKKYYDEMQDLNKQVDWAFIRAIAEVTRSESISKRMTDSINSKAYLMFLCQYNRRFVVALSFTAAEKQSFRLTVTDREGQIHWTVGLNTARSKERSILFLRILVVLMFGRSSDLGLDPNIEIASTGKCAAITIQEKRFEVLDLIYSLDSVVGRGTRIWAVMHEGVRYVLKDCWIQHERVHSEVSILQKIKSVKKFTGRVPSLFCGGDVEINGAVDSTEEYRSGLPGWCSKGKRVHRQLVCSPIGEPLSKYRSKKEFIKAIISIVTTHQMLFNDHGILHRDISLNNLLLFRPKEDECADGLLIDFDYSEELDIVGADGGQAIEEYEVMSDVEESEAGTADVVEPEAWSEDEASFGLNSVRTGTPPFMAIEALIAEGKKFDHFPRHDLESILYVILFVCTFTKGPNLARPDHEMRMLNVPNMKTWFSTGPIKTIGFRKIAHMCQPELLIIPGFTEYWKDFSPFALDLIRLCFPINPTKPNELTHKAMLSILDKASTTVKEPPTKSLETAIELPTKNLKRDDSEPSNPPVHKKRMKRKLEKV